MKYTFLALMCALLLLPLGLSAQQRGPLQTVESGVELLGPELDSTQNYTAVLETNQGTITIELFADKAPLTVRNFVNLAEGTKPWRNPKTNVTEKKPYYDGIIFHRVIKGFMIQGGDIEGTGGGGPGFRFGDEVNNGLSFAKTPYALAMANAGPSTNGSQFFITDKGSLPNFLDGKHTIFGKVIEGQDVVDKIASVPKGQTNGRPNPRGQEDRPNDPQTINKVTIKRTPKADAASTQVIEAPDSKPAEATQPATAPASAPASQPATKPTE
jgi:peptidyl-prolyl cis-trans isomerase A (cyclophilin A)